MKSELRLFISYARTDYTLASHIVEILRQAGLDPWFDRRLLAGQEFKAILGNELRDCFGLVFMISPDSIKSEWCIWELNEAMRLKKPIIPILLRPTIIPETLSVIQYEDFTASIGPFQVARLIGAILKAVYVPFEAPFQVENPGGFPAQVSDVNVPSGTELDSVAENHSQTNWQIEEPTEVLKILPFPFEWRLVTAGTVNLEPLSGEYFVMDAGKSLTYLPPRPRSELKETLSKRKRSKVADFFISRYPITNAQYQQFVKADNGYKNRQWWGYSPRVEAWWESNQRPKSVAFRGERIPRTNASWYEAMAFCLWLSEMTSTQVRLPTRAEWQRAAQGDEKQPFPWGNTFYQTRCNSKESRLDKLVVVDKYLHGASGFGVLDLAGNAAEWVLESTEDLSDVFGDPKLICGGCFKEPALKQVTDNARYTNAGFRFDSVGFRIVMTT